MDQDQRRIINSLFVPGLFVLIIWIVKFSELIFRLDLGAFGLQPLQWKGLIGIVTAPLLHADFSHLAANTLPLFFLCGMLFYFYKEIAWPVLLLIWLLTGVWVWLLARGTSIHIGASGIVYGLAAFLFLSGILRRDARLMSITLLIAFLYGGLVWGVFPQLFPNKPISWESHLMGLVAGSILAWYFRKSGPQRRMYSWELEEDDEDEDDDETGAGTQEIPGEFPSDAEEPLNPPSRREGSF